MTSPTVPADGLPIGYSETLEQLKAAVRSAQLKARRAVNTELIALYWEFGRTILARQRTDGWGSRVIDRLATDLHAEFPTMTGLSRSNLEYMRRFALAWPDAIPPQAVGELPWGHIRTLLDKLNGGDERQWYAAEAVANGWSRAVLAVQISTGAHIRAGTAPSNFAAQLPPGDSDLAQQIVKDPYIFEFLTAEASTAERVLEAELVSHLRQTLLEFGRGFAFIGQQYAINVAGDEFFIDLLFYNTIQHRYVVVELKVDKFRPKHTGQLNFYVQWVEGHLRGERDDPTIGLLLCADRNDEVVRLALNGTTAPMAVADWKALPPAAHAAMPEIDAVVQAVQEGGPVQLTLHSFFESTTKHGHGTGADSAGEEQ